MACRISVPIVLCICIAMPFAAQRASTPNADAAAREAARVSTTARGHLRPGLKWTGIGLIVGGALPFHAAVKDECFTTTEHCRLVGNGLGVAMASAGALLLGIAYEAHVPIAPTLLIDGGRTTIQQRSTF